MTALALLAGLSIGFALGMAFTLASQRALKALKDAEDRE